MDRFDRNIRFFGAEGQRRIRTSRVAIVGCGGLGQHVVQQLAFLGVTVFYLIDDEDLSMTNLNRYILARHDDPIPGTHKVDMALRAIAAANPEAGVFPVRSSLRSIEAFEALRHANIIFGCVDNDGARLVLNEFALAYGKLLIDLASDIEAVSGLRYGGRVAVVGKDHGCLVCMDLIDLAQALKDLESEASRRDRARIYGVDPSDLDEAGPSVVSINGVVASLAVTEFILAITGIRAPKQLTNYRANQGIVAVTTPTPISDCYYCNKVRGSSEQAGVERYLPSA